MDNQAKNRMQVTYKIDPGVEGGVYTNSATIFHNETDFVFDFGFSLPGSKPIIKIHSRVITNPQHAKRFLRALADNIRGYEATYGEIKDGIRPDATHSGGDLIN